MARRRTAARGRRTGGRFMTDIRMAAERGPHWSASAMLALVTLFALVALIWAALARIDQVTIGTGRVIPSRELQVVQSVDGGVVTEILVRQGESVRQGQPLLRLDPTRATATYGSDRASYLGLIAAQARLRAELEGQEPVFPQEVRDEAPSIVSSETALFRGRKTELRSEIDVLRRQRDQRRQEVAELQSRLSNLRGQLTHTRGQLRIAEESVAAGLISQMELLQRRRDVADLTGQIESTRLAIPRARAAIQEADQRIEERTERFRSEALDRLNEIEVELAALGSSIKAQRDMVDRTEVRSPVDGTVNSLAVNTVGGVVKPGETVVEVVPEDDSLLVEARIRPSDVAFLHPGQSAKVRITAFDFAVYGSLTGELERISADTIVDDQGDSFYEIQVRTAETFRDRDDRPLPIRPGMVAEVNIVTGTQTVLDYVMNPIIRVQGRAFQ